MDPENLVLLCITNYVVCLTGWSQSVDFVLGFLWELLQKSIYFLMYLQSNWKIFMDLIFKKYLKGLVQTWLGVLCSQYDSNFSWVDDIIDNCVLIYEKSSTFIRDMNNFFFQSFSYFIYLSKKIARGNSYC